jgi:Cu/Ag efflux protein CusF
MALTVAWAAGCQDGPRPSTAPDPHGRAADPDHCDCDACKPTTKPAATAAAAPTQASGMSMPGMSMNGGTAATPEVYHARGRVVTAAFDGKTGQGASLVVDHEDIPGYMSAMRMTFAVTDPAQAAHLHAGDKIAFDLARQASGDYAIVQVKSLPADTVLRLAGVAADVPDIVRDASGGATTRP